MGLDPCGALPRFDLPLVSAQQRVVLAKLSFDLSQVSLEIDGLLVQGGATCIGASVIKESQQSTVKYRHPHHEWLRQRGAVEQP
mmetsp:Transcript_59684/g.115188  ORF Transcript_59684/g.115188 Transcript_59684/m.115188 type:complete len:84 (+) Transcript_59684:107-358(+)